MKSLCLAFSCTGERLTNLLRMLSEIPKINGVYINIFLQNPISEFSSNSPEYLHIYCLDNVGLSKSRNAAIVNVESDFIWFLDDDVCLTEKDVRFALNIIQEGDADFFRIRIGCIEDKRKCYKRYNKVSKVRRVNLLQVSSIEIIADLTYIKKQALQFNENIGLGTKYGGGEEVHFLIDAWERGARFVFSDTTAVYHSCREEGRTLANNEIFEIRGATASRFRSYGALLILRWSFRYFLKYKNLTYLRALVVGYIRGYNAYK